MFGIKTLGITLALGTLALAGAAPVEYVKLDGKGAFVAHGVGVASIEGDGKFSVEGRGAVVVIAGRDPAKGAAAVSVATARMPIVSSCNPRAAAKASM